MSKAMGNMERNRAGLPPQRQQRHRAGEIKGRLHAALSTRHGQPWAVAIENGFRYRR